MDDPQLTLASNIYDLQSLTQCPEHLTLALVAACFFITVQQETCYSGVIAFSVITIQVFTLMKVQCFNVFYKSYVDLDTKF